MSSLWDAKNEYIYFSESENRERIRIGYTHDLNTRRPTVHDNYGYTLRAIIRGTKVNEKYLHDYFEPHRIIVGTDRSQYSSAAVASYVNRLLEYNFATNDIEMACKLGKLEWTMWAPSTLEKPLIEKDQFCLFVTPGLKAEARDIWQTPDDVAEICRKAFGGDIDLDPASCFEANLRIKAKTFYTERENGLRLSWKGKVFLNPPYAGREGGEAAAPTFVAKLLHEIKDGNTIEAITVLNLQSVATIWFRELVNPNASVHAIWNGRIRFIGPGGAIAGKDRHTSSQNGTIFSYFGANIERFAEAFLPYAWIIRTVCVQQCRKAAWPNTTQPTTSRSRSISPTKPSENAWQTAVLAGPQS